MRFDEVELQSVPFDAEPAPPPAPSPRTPILKHALALLTDLSLFAALALALSPLLPQPPTRIALVALIGFVLMLSFYYFAGAWTLWGKTVGGAIFDVRVEKRTLRNAAMRWVWMVVGIGIVAAVVTAVLW
ncbi:MAG: hypothetical protein DMF56_11995 [Acidobacteria bacterium]|nr:MAG: hypothetical protein DMF56_11995 [Acidobacteriota bacterium]